MGFLRDNIWMLTASVLGGAGLYVLRIALGRALTPAQFGQFSTVASVLMIMGFLIGAVGYTSTKLLDDLNIIDLIAAGFLLSAGFALIVLVLHPIVVRYLETTRLLLLAPILFNIPVMTYYQPILGFHQREKNFEYISFSEILEAAFLFIVSGLIFCTGSIDLLVAVMIPPLSGLVSTIAILPKSPFPSVHPSVAGIRETLADLPNSLGINSLLLVPTTFDMLIVSAKFTGAIVGFWAVLSVFGKAYVVVSRAISRVMFADTAGNGRNPLLKSVAIGVFLSIGGTAIGGLFPAFWITTLFGEKYAELVGLMPLYMVAMLPYPAIALTGIHFFGTDQSKEGFLLFGGLIALYPLILLTTSLSQVVYILLAAHYLLLLILAVYSYLTDEW